MPGFPSRSPGADRAHPARRRAALDRHPQRHAGGARLGLGLAPLAGRPRPDLGHRLRRRVGGKARSAIRRRGAPPPAHPGHLRSEGRPMMNLAEYRRRPPASPISCPGGALSAKASSSTRTAAFQRTARFRGPDLDPRCRPSWSPSPDGSTTPSAASGSGWASSSRRNAMASGPIREPLSRSRVGPGRRRAQGRLRGSRARFRVQLFSTFVYLPPAEDAARAEGWLYEGPSEQRRRSARGAAASPIAPTACCSSRRLHAGMRLAR